MALGLSDIISLLLKHVDAEDHVVFVDGEQKGTCTRASFRFVVTLRGIEFPVDYAYELEGATHTYSSRPSRGGLGKGGREQIKVDGQEVEGDDVIVGADDDTGLPGLHVEFRYKQGGTDHSVKFVAPLAAVR